MTAVQVNQPLGRLATALRRHDMDFPQSDDGRVYKQGADQRDALLAMARELDRADVLVVVELEARKQCGARWETYVEQFAVAMEAGR